MSPHPLVWSTPKCHHFSRANASAVGACKNYNLALTVVEDLGLVGAAEALLLQRLVVHVVLLDHSVVELEPFALVRVGEVVTSSKRDSCSWTTEWLLLLSKHHVRTKTNLTFHDIGVFQFPIPVDFQVVV